MLRPISPNPKADAKLTYSQGIMVPCGVETLYISGQVGVSAAGVVAPDFEAQARQAWENLVDVLSAADMWIDNLVKLTAFLTDARDYPLYAALRGKFLGDHKPTSTLLVVASLALPLWKFEIEGVAVRTR